MSVFVDPDIAYAGVWISSMAEIGLQCTLAFQDVAIV